jgi:hypothetical protein
MRLLLPSVALLAALPLGAQDTTNTTARDNAIRALALQGMPGDVAYVTRLVVRGDTAIVDVTRYRPPRPGELTDLYSYQLRLLRRGDQWVPQGLPRTLLRGTIGSPTEPSKPSRTEPPKPSRKP